MISNNDKFKFLKAFFEFSNIKINLRIYFYIFISVISSFLDVLIIYYISSYVISFNSGEPIKNQIFKFILTIDSSSAFTYYLFFLLCLITYLSKVFINFYTYKLGALYGSLLTKKFLKAYSKVSYQFHLNLKESEFVTYYAEDITNTVGAVNASFSFLTSVITFSIYVCFLLFKLPIYIFLSFLIICAINYFCVYLLITKKVTNLGRKMKEINPIRIKKFIDFYSLYKVHKVFGISNILLNDILKTDKEYRLFLSKAPFLISLPSITIIYLLYVIGIALFSFQSLVGSYGSYIDYFISLGLIIQRMIPSSNLIQSSLNTIRFKSISLIKIFDYYQLMKKGEIKDNDLNIISKNLNSSQINSNRDFLISFKSVNFRHENAKRDLYINDLIFDILPKSNLLITGPSGSGKSTLIDIILSLREPIKGEIFYNSRYSYISDLLTYVPQNSSTIDGSLMDNLVLGDHQSRKSKDKSKIDSIIKCCLLDEVVRKSSLGLNQKIGYGGIQLSGGQLQRLAIARALFRDVPLLLMDEPTSSLDEETSKLLIKNLLSYALKKSMSIVVVSHDSSIFPFFKNNIRL